jgi:hypothetical protein
VPLQPPIIADDEQASENLRSAKTVIIVKVGLLGKGGPIAAARGNFDVLVLFPIDIPGFCKPNPANIFWRLLIFLESIVSDRKFIICRALP